MGTTKIEWTDKVWNPITGCSPVSEGCQNCYARRMANRLKGRYGYPKDEPFRVTFHADRLDEPLHWKKPSRIFVCSMGDIFHDDVDGFWLSAIWSIMERCYWHTFLILTKRPERWKRLTPQLPTLNNVWLSTSVENQPRADQRVPELLKIPAAKGFISVEPMLGPMDIKKYLCGHDCEDFGLCQMDKFPRQECLQGGRIAWVICGGETGPGARPMNPDWARSLRDDCKRAGVPFFFKQMSGKKPIPKDLMVREFPK